MKVKDIFEARYFRHPALNWIDEQMAKDEPVADALTLNQQDYETVDEVLRKELGTPTQDQKDNTYWTLKNDRKEYYLDLQRLVGVPEDQSLRLTISSLDSKQFYSWPDSR